MINTLDPSSILYHSFVIQTSTNVISFLCQTNAVFDHCMKLQSYCFRTVFSSVDAALMQGSTSNLRVISDNAAFWGLVSGWDNRVYVCCITIKSDDRVLSGWTVFGTCPSVYSAVGGGERATAAGSAPRRAPQHWSRTTVKQLQVFCKPWRVDACLLASLLAN